MKNAGTVIHGTMRPQDLIPAFLDELEVRHPEAYEQIMLIPFGPIPSYVIDEGDDSEWWASNDAAWLLESLFDALNECCDDGYYFGAHEGDGSDYGFWQSEDNF